MSPMKKSQRQRQQVNREVNKSQRQRQQVNGEVKKNQGRSAMMKSLMF